MISKMYFDRKKILALVIGGRSHSHLGEATGYCKDRGLKYTSIGYWWKEPLSFGRGYCKERGLKYTSIGYWLLVEEPSSFKRGYYK